MIFEPFDVLLVPFPFLDLPIRRKRPGIVVSSEAFIAAHGVLHILMITTAGRSTWDSDVRLLDYEAAGLRQPCVARLKIASLQQRLVVRRIGRLSVVDRRAVAASMAASLATAL